MSGGLAGAEGVDLYWKDPEGRIWGRHPGRLVLPHKTNYLIVRAALQVVSAPPGEVFKDRQMCVCPSYDSGKGLETLKFFSILRLEFSIPDITDQPTWDI